MKLLYLTLFIPSLFLSCKQSSSTGETSSEDAKTLEAKVMTLHDEVMPKVNEISDLGAQLRKYKAALPESPDGRIDSPDGLDQVMESMKLSEQGMWEWMKAYSDTKPTLTEDQVKPFMEKQLDILNKVNQDMTSSIDKAKAWIAAHPAQ
jgi:hypothetical protein